jgi:hypothetical protein
MSEAYVAVQYIGCLPTKVDNIVHGSGLIWKGQFSSQRIRESEAYKYLRHSDEFRLLHPLFLESDYAASLSKDDQLNALQTICSNLELHAAEELMPVLQERIRDLREMSVRAPQSTSPDDRQRFLDRRLKVADAIAKLDIDDPNDYTDTKKPRVSRVKEISGLNDVSAAEIRQVQSMKEAAAPAG